MANLNTRPAPIDPFAPQQTLMQPLASVARPTGEADTAAATVSAKLADAAGEWADSQAKQEGAAAGKVAAMDPEWRPSKLGTLRAAAADAAGTQVYTSNLTADFRSKALDLYQANQDNPVAFNAGFQRLQQEYTTQHAFPEIAGDFRAQTTAIESTLRLKVLSNFDDKQKDQNRAQLTNNMASRDYNATRLLAAAPEDPEGEKAVNIGRDQNIADINAGVARGDYTAENGAKYIQAAKDGAVMQIALARANAAKTPDDVALYRDKLKKDFAAGKLPDFTQWTELDAKLATIARGKKTALDQGLGDLRKKSEDFLTRFGRGDTPSAVDLMAIDAAGGGLGPQGVAIVAATHQKLANRVAMSGLSPIEQEAYVRRLEQQAKAAPRADDPAQKQFFLDRGAPQFDGVAQGFATQLQSAIADAEAATGQKARVVSMARTTAQQAELYAKYQAGEIGLAAAPGHSRHERGEAADIAAGPVLDWLHGHAGAYGLAFLPGAAGAKDPGHIQMAGPAAGGGVSSLQSEVLQDARDFMEGRRKLVASDPLLSANRDFNAPIADVDFTAPADKLAQQFGARHSQAQAVASAYQRAPQYIRPDEKPVIDGVLKQGGDKAMALLGGIIQGAGADTPAVLREIGGDAPELAHAALLKFLTGDDAFARQVANGVLARNTDGAKTSVASPPPDMVEKAMRDTLGTALQGLDPQERQRTKASAVAWAEQEFIKRNVSPKDAIAAPPILQEAIKRARGMTGSGADTFGGVEDVSLGGYWKGNRTRTEAPVDVRAGRFADTLDAITDADLKGLKNPPVDSKGDVLTAEALRQRIPVSTGGGYRWADKDARGGLNPIVARDGRPFTLNWAEIAPALRARLPDAFR